MKKQLGILGLILICTSLTAFRASAESFAFYSCLNDDHSMTISEDALTRVLDVHLADLNGDEHDYVQLLPLLSFAEEGMTMLPSLDALTALKGSEFTESSRTGVGNIFLEMMNDVAYVTGDQSLVFKCQRAGQPPASLK